MITITFKICSDFKNVSNVLETVQNPLNPLLQNLNCTESSKPTCIKMNYLPKTVPVITILQQSILPQTFTLKIILYQWIPTCSHCQMRLKFLPTLLAKLTKQMSFDRFSHKVHTWPPNKKPINLPRYPIASPKNRTAQTWYLTKGRENFPVVFWNRCSNVTLQFTGENRHATPVPGTVSLGSTLSRRGIADRMCYGVPCAAEHTGN